MRTSMQRFWQKLWHRDRRPIRTRTQTWGAKPCLEALEDRWAPAVYTVNTLADTIDHRPAVTSLREAVQSANAHAGPDQVNFAKNLDGAIVLTRGAIRITSPLTITVPNPNEVTVVALSGKAFVISASSGPVTIDEQLTVMDGHGSTANPRVRPRLTSVTPVDPNTLVLDFNTTLGRSAARVSSYVIHGLTVESVTATRYPNRVVLTTSPQAAIPYTLSLNNLRDRSGKLVQVLNGAVELTGSDADDREPPRVVGAVSLGNNTLLVSFSEPMADSALNPAYYAITQASAGSEAATLPVRVDSPAFVNFDRTAVVLTTSSQSELTYTVKVVNVTDLAGNPFAPAVLAGGQRIATDQTNFTGTPPSGDQLVDSDGDGLTDNEELRGWQVTFKPANGVPQTRWVTSDPTNEDTDGDGFTDDVEKQLVLDPRDQDTDDDLLTDWQEYNEVFSDHLNGDTDGDGVDDGTEFLGVKSSPVFADTDGDQIPDGLEIPLGGARNILVSDLPRPEISVGNVNLQLDVRFTESNNRESRDLGTESFRTTLANATTNTHVHQDTWTWEAHASARFGRSEEGNGFFAADVGGSGGYTYNSTDETVNEARREYEKSFQTEHEVTQGFSAERSVQGASMQVAIDLSNLSDLAYRVKNLQVTAFIQDPLNHTRLTPIATLVPDFEPEDGFTLGPLVANHGPIIFSNTTIIPSLVESLMANSTGLIFRISNYDIVNEDGRNFAFASQDVIERTGAVRIDFGGAGQLLAEVNGEDVDDTNPPREPEIHRVATSSGRAIADTNEDGKINEDDRRVTFDLAGKEVGITLHSALQFIGLTHFEARLDPATGQYLEYEPGSSEPIDFTNQEEKLNSYSTIRVGGLDRIYRIRDIANDPINDRFWEIIDSQGIVPDVDLDTLVLNAGKTISLNYVQDLDQDGLPADVEYFLRTSDSPLPVGAVVPGSTNFTTSESVTFATDPGFATGTLVRITDTASGLTTGTDYFVRNLGAGSYSFYTSEAEANTGTTSGRVNLTGSIKAGVFAPARVQDVNLTSESVTFATDPGFATGTLVRVTASGGGLTAGTDYFVRNVGGGHYSFYTSEADATTETTNRVDLNGLVTAGVFSPTPRGRDTDHDGLDDRFEALIGWQVTTPQRTYQVYSSPNRADSNFDNPKAGVDSDGDGTEDRLEYDGFDRAAAPDKWEDKNNNGLRDPGEVSQTATSDYVLDPIRKDTDGDGIDDATEVIGFKITRVTNGSTFVVSTYPNTPFSDSDTFSDGFERLVGLNPMDGNDTDDDGDGLPDLVEIAGWAVGKETLVVDPTRGGVPDITFESDPFGLGFQDVVWFQTSDPDFATGTPVGVSATGGGLTAGAVYFVSKSVVDVFNLNIPVHVYTFHTSEADALAGRNPVDLTGAITASVNPLISVRRVEGVSLAPYQAGPFTEKTGKSRTDSVDSDGDGLTDYEEFFLRTDPSSADTDGDGLDDRTESLGYTLGHKVADQDLGIIKTDPLDADTDNDKRSDGVEAELVDIERNRWVVRVAGLAPYRVYSNPLVADADYDGVVDGVEFGGTYRTDPNNGNTDSDKRDDGQELNAGTNPLIEDFQVTVFINSLYVGETGDGLTSELGPFGEFMFQLGVRKPDLNGTAGLSSALTPVVTQSIELTSPYHFVRTDASQVEPFLPTSIVGLQVYDQNLTNNVPGILFAPDSTLNFAQYLPIANRSISFGMTANQSFALEGIVAEWDLNDGYSFVYLGGFDGSRVTDGTRPIFRGADLLAATTTSPFKDVTIEFKSDQTMYLNNGGGAISGNVSFTIFVS